MEILSKLFGSEARVKILRLFIFNPEATVDIDMISDRSKVNRKIAKKECDILEKVHLVKAVSFFKTVKRKKRGKTIEVKVRTRGYQVNQNFSYLGAFQALLVSTKMLEGGEVLKKLSKVGKLKLVIIAGIFTQTKDSRLDMLVVGDNLKKPILNSIIKSIEAELGRELMYAYFETSDFNYRLRMYDKLVKDVLDYPHQVLLDKLF